MDSFDTMRRPGTGVIHVCVSCFFTPVVLLHERLREIHHWRLMSSRSDHPLPCAHVFHSVGHTFIPF